VQQWGQSDGYADDLVGTEQQTCGQLWMLPMPLPGHELLYGNAGSRGGTWHSKHDRWQRHALHH
jgi:hypothetical protein